MSRNMTKLPGMMEIFCFDLGGSYPGIDIDLIFTKLHT